MKATTLILAALLGATAIVLVAGTIFLRKWLRSSRMNQGVWVGGLLLVPGAPYGVIKEFTDYREHTHLPGDRWTFVRKSVWPYMDAVILEVERDGKADSICLQETDPAAYQVLAAFNKYVKADDAPADPHPKKSE